LTAKGLLSLLDANMAAATHGAEVAKARKAALEKKQEEVRRNVKVRGAGGSGNGRHLACR
jgi:hypothetical protein